MLKIIKSYSRSSNLVNILVINLAIFLCIISKISGEQNKNFLLQCCSLGKMKASLDQNPNCHEHDSDTINNIPQVWLGLCVSTFTMCCSKELQNRQCSEGRNFARNGQNCDNGSTALNKAQLSTFINCCKACQIGLVVSTSGQNCMSQQFSYFQEDESYLSCCLDNNRSEEDNFKESEINNNDKTNIRIDLNTNEEENSNETFVLSESDNICKKFSQKLCSQICQNTKESYICKCYPGYVLETNGVTCSKIDKTFIENYDVEEVFDEDDILENSAVNNFPNNGAKCPNGYIKNEVSGDCEDIDECSSYQSSKCSSNEFCENTIGSYICLKSSEIKCHEGFKYNLKTKECEDIDECVVDKNACDSNQICTNENGGYRCNCKIGFKMDSMLNACVDINECQINNHNCLASQRCDNTIGSYTCIRLVNCGTGYTLNAETGNCDDDDECELNTHDCPSGYVCRNTVGSFRCDRKRQTPHSRHTTFFNRIATTQKTTLSSSTSRSIVQSPEMIFNDTSSGKFNVTTQSNTIKPTHSSTSNKFYVYLNPAQPNNRTQNVNEVNNLAFQQNEELKREKLNNQNKIIFNEYSNKGLEMPCNKGFRKSEKGACIDVNECEIPGACETHQRCINTNGSFRCINLLQCSGGYKASSDGNSCVDIDECFTGEHNCSPDQICRNRIGGYICSCPIGHTLDKFNHCKDINECDHQICPINANCFNTVGSYYCDCKPGFKKQTSNNNICADIDECQELSDLCEQKCINYWGSYRCTCNAGYEININNNRSCDDINECEIHKPYQLCNGLCNNVPGSYECSCPPGYELEADKNSCRDVDECLTMNVCQGQQEICTNIRGSYKCTHIKCPEGYINDNDQKNRCRIMNQFCEGSDCINRPSAYTYSFITLVSNMMISPNGRTFFSLRGPQWMEKIDFDLKIIQIQAPHSVKKATLRHFSTTQVKNQVQINLLRSLEGPQDIELELTMTVFMDGQPRGKSVAKIFIFVSQYSF